MFGILEPRLRNGLNNSRASKKRRGIQFKEEDFDALLGRVA